ncbi:hypothetical protein KL921_001604 [Ogataea angusta]|uniref:Uncharacterized protein n=1 Tax=Pichia angusta TaxID=870730 RepID=A0AAN6I629_PICAN|nr:uncharacterized protein KL928_002840 [Ogataea angusta]KAG7812372.1 hypothetical protein KL921_001604 [Ogataea angusta]KAG7818972.1 hypothetical protein KL928_002840 [Ogataea angusta]KAG7825219.1 hypothetical protein KL909_001511 [Ogataea angusta]KAG7830406.1 hypothetical protein KL920_002044 [Ogataea angusta]KAG7834463.1 hypothetical protein KL943_002847 [Ogataea angusta]
MDRTAHPEPPRLLRSQDPSSLPDYLRELKNSKLVTLSYIPASKKKARKHIESGVSHDIPISILSKSPSLLIPISTKRRARANKPEKTALRPRRPSSAAFTNLTQKQDFSSLFPDLVPELTSIAQIGPDWAFHSTRIAVVLQNYAFFYNYLRQKRKELRNMHRNTE